MNFISLSLAVLIIAFNFYLFTITNKKIQIFNEIPPFIWLDYTNSEWKNPNSKLKNLFDKNLNTFWKKEKESPKDWDLELELKLTHIFMQNTYIPRPFQYIKIYFCGEPKIWSWEVFLNEAINVDKELRFPNSKTIAKAENERIEAEKLISLPKLDLQATTSLDQNVSIYGIRIQAQGLGGCISEIELKNEN